MNEVMILAQAAVDPAPEAVAPAGTQAVESQPAVGDELVAPEEQQPGGLFGGGATSLLIWILLFVGLWFLLFMPQRKRQKALQKLQNELKVGDAVYTTSGIVGKIVALDKATVTLQVSEGTRIPFLRNAIVGLANAPEAKK